MITTEKLEKNYRTWIGLLKKYSCYSDELIEKYGELIKNASYSTTTESGLCYQGSLLDVSINKLTKFGLEILSMNLPEEFLLSKVNKDSLIRVFLLQHISKSILFVKNTDEWKRKHGYEYMFSQDLITSMKVGERSLFMCMECGIKLDETEFEAIRIIDKDENDDKGSYYSSLLSNIVKITNSMVNYCSREYNKQLNILKNKIEE